MDLCGAPSLHHHLHHSHRHTGVIILMVVLLTGTPQTGLSEQEGTKLLQEQQEKELLQKEEEHGLQHHHHHQLQEEQRGEKEEEEEEEEKKQQHVKVFGLQKGLWTEPDDDVFIRHRLWRRHRPPPLRVFTVCYWIRLDRFIIFIPHVSYATSERDNELLIYSIDDKIGTYLKGEHQSHHTYASSFYPDTWTHLCHAFGNATYTVYWQGQVLTRDPLLDFPGLELNGTLVLGQEQDTVGGGFDKEQALYGDISQLSIWDRELSPSDVAELAGCRSLGRGNVFNLDTASVEVVGDVQESTVDFDVFCRSLDDWDQDIIFPEVRTFPRIQSVCRLLNGSMSVPRSDEDNERLFEELKPFLSACNPRTKWKLWLGMTDEAEEGAWVDIQTQRRLKYTNFRPPYPNGGTLYSCGMMTDEGIWADSNCNAKRCGACRVTRSSILYLRGLCFETEHRTHFRWFGYAGGRPLFRGFYNYVIMWDEEKEVWLLRHTETNETLAWLDIAEGYPLGRHKWSSNGSLCDESLPSSLHLSLSLCTEEQFACASGHCIDNHSRCNLFHDCDDGSDEENCSVVGLRAGYQQHLPPRGHHDSPLDITPGITLTRISDVDGISMVINLEFLLLLTWRDDRVSFRHLDRSTKTLIPKRDSEKLWRPRAQAMNLLAGEIKLLDETFVVGPASNATIPNFNSVERDLVYPGTHNDITLSTHSAAKFTCSFDLYFYPFDVQECSIDLHLLDDFEGSVRFAEGGGTASYTGPKDLALYTVRNVHLDSDRERRNLLCLKFELQRRLGVILLSTFVPSVLLLSVSWATLFVKLEALNVRAIMSLTTLLVLYTLFSNLSSSIPHTAAIKLIDIWFFFIILLIFMNIMMHIFIEFVVLLPKKTHRVVPIHQSVLRAEKVMCFYRFFVFPPVFSIFNLVFWSIVFLDNKNQL